MQVWDRYHLNIFSAKDRCKGIFQLLRNVVSAVTVSLKPHQSSECPGYFTHFLVQISFQMLISRFRDTEAVYMLAHGDGQ